MRFIAYLSELSGRGGILRRVKVDYVSFKFLTNSP